MIASSSLSASHGHRIDYTTMSNTPRVRDPQSHIYGFLCGAPRKPSAQPPHYTLSPSSRDARLTPTMVHLTRILLRCVSDAESDAGGRRL